MRCLSLGREKLLLCVGGEHGTVCVWLLPDALEEGWHQATAPKLAFELIDNSYYYPVTTLAIRADGAMLATGEFIYLRYLSASTESLYRMPSRSEWSGEHLVTAGWKSASHHNRHGRCAVIVLAGQHSFGYLFCPVKGL